jgi:hypothetical protein
MPCSVQHLELIASCSSTAFIVSYVLCFQIVILSDRDWLIVPLCDLIWIKFFIVFLRT